MKQVQVQESVYVEATGTLYEAGSTVEVSNELAERHLKTGFMKEVDVLLDPEPVTLRKANTKK